MQRGPAPASTGARARCPSLGGDGTGALDRAVELEKSGLIVLADRPFTLDAEERAVVSAAAAEEGVKSVSLDAAGWKVSGAIGDASLQAAVTALLDRYAAWARALVEEVAPGYGPALERGRTSLRPRQVAGWAASPRKDDRRLHADAFPSQPVGASRILRVFSNVDADGEPRVWRVGEDFEAYARRWLPGVRRNLPGEAWALRRLAITKSLRTDYDALMLGLHDRAKLDAAYQATASRREIAFPAGASWIVFTDSLVHAAISGRHALEQTFYLPVAAMADERAAPLRILERLTGRRLAP